MTRTPDYLIVGGGIIGLTVALEVRRRFPDAGVVVLEKEGRVGLHASGRNSGVLHAGFYYSEDSLKARFSREGTKRWTELCLERGLPINRCGKLVVAKDASELSGLEELRRRGEKNGVEVQLVDEAEAGEIDPLARTVQSALWSPTTASVDPSRVMEEMAREAIGKGIEITTDTLFLRRKGAAAETSAGVFEPGYLINAAGVYADRIARDFGFAQDLTILPFKGLYLYGDPAEAGLRVHLYPVPDLEKPFLGVHFTLSADGRVKIGPTATPAFWREHYRGLENLRLAEMLPIVGREASLFLRNDFGFRSMALEELKKYSRRKLARMASRLVRDMPMDSFRRWGKPGIRAQLFHTKERRLEMDFRVEGDDRSFHVLNAISPAFTCALPFAEFVLDEVERLRSE